jgi:hypothetical protein
MYKIFFHLLGIIILEIIFYFFYIGPFEHSVFVNSFSRSIGGLIKKIDYAHENPLYFLNISSFEKDDSFMNDLKNEADASDKVRIEYNNNLCIATILIWICCTVFLIFTILFYHLIKYFIKKYKSKLHQNIELVELTNNSININSVKNIENKPNEKKNLVIMLLTYLFFGCLILLFEYVFFQYSVLKYQIITDKQIQYLVYQQIDKFVLSYYIIN